MLFDKEAILQYIITKKTEYCRELKEYDRQKKQEEQECNDKEVAETTEKISKFLKTEHNIVTTKFVSTPTAGSSKAETSISNMANGNDKELPSFWIPSKTPQAAKSTLKKPVKFSTIL